MEGYILKDKINFSLLTYEFGKMVTKHFQVLAPPIEEVSRFKDFKGSFEGESVNSLIYVRVGKRVVKTKQIFSQSLRSSDALYLTKKQKRNYFSEEMGRNDSSEEERFMSKLKKAIGNADKDTITSCLETLQRRCDKPVEGSFRIDYFVELMAVWRNRKLEWKLEYKTTAEEANSSNRVYVIRGDERAERRIGIERVYIKDTSKDKLAVAASDDSKRPAMTPVRPSVQIKRIRR